MRNLGHLLVIGKHHLGGGGRSTPPCPPAALPLQSSCRCRRAVSRPGGVPGGLGRAVGSSDGDRAVGTTPPAAAARCSSPPSKAGTMPVTPPAWPCGYLAETWVARRFATVDPEEFYDFTVTRPQVRHDRRRRAATSTGPSTELWAAARPGAGRDVVLLRGRRAPAQVADLLRRRGRGGPGGSVPRWPSPSAPCWPTYPTPGPSGSSGMAHESALADRLGLRALGLRGPDRHPRHPPRRVQPRRAALRVAVGDGAPLRPQVPSPKAALALVERSAALARRPASTPSSCGSRPMAYVRQVSERVADDEEAAAYVAQLEEADDLEQQRDVVERYRAATPWPPRWSASSATAPRLAGVPRSCLRVAPGSPPPKRDCVWRATPELIVALDDRFGEPVDAYVNGSQVWLRDDGPGGITLEWRLHPVAGYRRPAAIGAYEIFRGDALALATGARAAGPARPALGGPRGVPRLRRRRRAGAAGGGHIGALGIPPDASRPGRPHRHRG